MLRTRPLTSCIDTDDTDDETPVVPPPGEELPTGAPFVAYTAIRDALVARGVAAHEIAFIQDATSRSKREALMDAVRRGAIRVLLAGAQNTGLNVQERLIAVHNLDVPWRPGDLEQRIGRTQRQGNHWPEVFVCNYAVEGSFDAFLWQTNHTKAQFIAQFERGDVRVREIDDIGGLVMTAAEMKAIASGNPQIVRKFAVDGELARLDGLSVAWRETQGRMRQRLHEIDSQRQRHRAEHALLVRAATAVTAVPTTPFVADVAAHVGSPPTQRMTTRAAAGAAIQELVQTICDWHGIRAVERQEPWLWSIDQRVVLARYQGVLLECVVTRGQRATVLLSLPESDQVQMLPDTSIAMATEAGIWSSVDAALRGFDARVAGLDRTLAALDQDEASIATALSQPWEYEASYSALIAERDVLYRALGIGATRETTADGEPAPDTAEPSDTTAGIASLAATPAWMALPPPVVLPVVRDGTAMAVARAQLVALDQARERTASSHERESDRAVVHPSAERAGTPHDAVQAKLAVGEAESLHDVSSTTSFAPTGTSKLVFGAVLPPTRQGKPKARRNPITGNADTPSASRAMEQLDLFWAADASG